MGTLAGKRWSGSLPGTLLALTGVTLIADVGQCKTDVPPS